MLKMEELSKTEETYLERIYDLTKEKGYANVVDIAMALNVKPPSVTEMLQKLEKHNLVNYERYRGVTLTKKGEVLAKSLEQFHGTLRRFFEILGVDKTIADEDACEIEHSIHHETIEKLTKFLKFIQESPKHPKWLEHFRYYEKTGRYRCRETE
ncbi:MAG: metal-dependent transcriptional regulator [Candidatus Methylarchaceae archaeon HK01B]|nr:metal-dependent transcriptional regulator [Candidatus Methylarchaceae archaeon HK01M]MCP8319298.1 metal-dependent transcriptional regulator [Candidatus Methylarchaceae archaeon HK01B]